MSKEAIRDACIQVSEMIESDSFDAQTRWIMYIITLVGSTIVDEEKFLANIVESINTHLDDRSW